MKKSFVMMAMMMAALTVNAQNDDLKNEIESKEDDPYKEKYEQEHANFEKFKADVKAEQLKADKTKAYKELLKEAGVSDKRIDSVLKVTAVDEIELDDEGKIKDADKMVENIKSEWSEFIVTETQRGAGTENPPTNSGGSKLSKADIYKKDDHGRYVLSTAERQKALMDISGN